MQRNLPSFGHIVDSGTIRGTSGIYSGKGYVVLEKFPESDQQRAETPRPELQHNVHWVYQPLAYSTRLYQLLFLMMCPSMSTPPGHR